MKISKYVTYINLKTLINISIINFNQFIIVEYKIIEFTVLLEKVERFTLVRFEILIRIKIGVKISKLNKRSCTKREKKLEKFVGALYEIEQSYTLN